MTFDREFKLYGFLMSQGMAHRTIEPAGHFLQQDKPGQCVQAILDNTGRS